MEQKKEKIPWKVVLPFGFILAGWSMLWAVYNNFVPVYLQAGNPVFDAAGSAVTFGFGLTAFTAGLSGPGLRRIMLDSVRDAIALKGEGATYLAVNRAFCDLLGRPEIVHYL